MSNQFQAHRAYTRFVPKKLTSCEIGKKHVRLHPTRGIGESWPDVETNFALNINKTALLNADISNVLVTDTLADYFDAMSQAQVHYHAFIDEALRQISNPDNLSYFCLGILDQ